MVPYDTVHKGTILLALIDLINAYGNIDHGRILQTPAGYGAGPKLWGLLEEFWLHQEVVTRQNGFHGPQLRATRRTTKGGLSSPTLFNVAVESVFHHWISLTEEEKSAIHDGFGMVVEISRYMFYADDGLIGSRDPEWLQGGINILIGLF